MHGCIRSIDSKLDEGTLNYFVAHEPVDAGSCHPQVIVGWSKIILNITNCNFLVFESFPASI
jgi:hypothetical protein